MASMNYVAGKLSAAGLTVDVDGPFILVEDPDLDFERSHDGVKGISRFCAETLEEYAELCAELFKDPGPYDEDLDLEEPEAVEDFLEDAPEEPEEAMGHKSGEEPEEEQMNIVQQRFKEELAKLAPPPKDHLGPAAQMEMAKEFHSPKEIAQAAETDDQDRGGVVNPEDYIRDMKLDAPAIVVLVKGQRFAAPEGYKIKEVRPGRAKPIYYGSIYQKRKVANELQGAKFSLVRQ